MLLAGKNIQAAAEPLQKIEVEHLFQSLQHPHPMVESRMRQLRIVRQTDAKLYTKLKKTLPYFVCGNFTPPIRKTENFAYIEYFVVDIDSLSEKQIDLSSARNWIETDPRVVMSFVSPSEDGLKVMFRLKERCYDAGLYKLFYKEFVRRFSQQYNLEQVVDSCTCDVCRACFVSIDPDAYYNPSVETIDLKEYLPTEDPSSLFALKHVQDQEEKEQEKLAATEVLLVPSEPSDDVLDNIKETLKMQREHRPKIPKLPIYVPERLEQIMDKLKSYIEHQGVKVYEIVSIQYGKKLRCKLGAKLAEINLFYGKRGFSVVQTPKACVSAELNSAVAELVQYYIDDNT